MTQLLPSALENWLPLVALLWLSSIGLLVICARKYFASRARPGAARESLPMQEPFIEIRAPLQMPPGHAGVADPDEREPRLETIGAIARTPESRATSLREAVRARVVRDRASAHGLGELVRALYLDQSNFRFDTIAELPTDDRDLAKALIEEWLADPSAVDYWEGIYATVHDVPSAVARPREQA